MTIDRANLDQRGIQHFCDDHSDDDIAEADVDMAPLEGEFDCAFLVVGKNHVRLKGRKKEINVPHWPEASAIQADELVETLQDRVIPKLHEDHSGELTLYGRTNMGGQLHYAHPCYGGSRTKQDWVTVQQQDGTHCPFQMLCIIHLEEDPTETIHFEDSSIERKGYYALGHYAVEPLRDDGKAIYEEGTEDEGNLAHMDQLLIHRIPKYCYQKYRNKEKFWNADKDNKPTLFAVDCSLITDGVVAWPDMLCDDPSNNYFFLKPRREWSQMLGMLAEKELGTTKKAKAARRKHKGRATNP